MPIRAIETRYAGCRFRSRLEARWAIFFDQMGIEWQYEPEGFELPSGRYLPDFYLPSLVIHGEPRPRLVEIKGRSMLRREWDLATELQTAIGVEVWVLAGDVPREPTCRCHPKNRPDLVRPALMASFRRKKHGPEEINCLFHGDGIQAALTAARSARFEHGERGVA